jgi:hypothetical protein
VKSKLASFYSDPEVPIDWAGFYFRLQHL